MNECPKCHNPIQETDKVCGQCGYPISPENESTSSNTAESSDIVASSAPAVQVKTNGFAIASLVLGIVSIPLICCCIGIIPAILAVIFGFIARNQIKESSGAQTGEGIALAGIITGFCAIGFLILLTVLSITGALAGNNYYQEFQKQLNENLPNSQL